MHDTLRITIKIPVYIYVILYNVHFSKKCFPSQKPLEAGKTLLFHFIDEKLGSEDKVTYPKSLSPDFMIPNFIILTYCTTINISVFKNK